MSQAAICPDRVKSSRAPLTRQACPGVRAPNSNRILSLVLLGAALLAGPLARGLVYETPTEFLTTGDFNGDGQMDVALVDRYSGRVRIGYRTAPGSFNWINWRAGG